MHGALHQPALQQEPLYKPPLHAFIWHLLCISIAEHSLQLQRGSKFVFCNTKLWCLPTNKLALTVTSNGRGGKKTKSKMFPDRSSRGWSKSAALVEQVCSKRWDFYNGYICFCKTYTVKDIYTVWWGNMQTGSQRAEYSGVNATAQQVDIYTVDVTTLRNLCY